MMERTESLKEPGRTDRLATPALKPYTVKEFAGEARLSVNAVYEMIRRGDVPAVRFGRAIRLPREACNKLLAGEAA
jgi:excisionase family DNA binding protein